MRDYTWWVSFEGSDNGVSVRAGCKDAAVILAQAHRIKNAQEWRRVRSVEMVGEAMARGRHVNPLA